MNINKLIEQFKDNFYLSLITVMGGVTALSFTSFAIYRFVKKDWLIGTSDSLTALIFFSLLIYVWCTKKIELVRYALICFSTIANVALAAQVGPPILHWVYTTYVGSFLLIHYSHSLLLCSLMMLGILLQPNLFLGQLNKMTFIVNSILICSYTLAFAYRYQVQNFKLETLAARDPLTSVFNRRTFEQELSNAYQNYLNNKFVYGLIMLDIDHFKRVNDAWGHEAGDQVLINFVKLIEKSIRESDKLFRYGGEEFVILIPLATPKSLMQMGENLRKKVEQQLSYEGQTITMSLGGAVIEQQESSQMWLNRADMALYEAKQNGRNQVIIDKIDSQNSLK